MRKLLVLLALMFLVNHTKASHILGGEISYRALDTLGNFRFQIVVYRDCFGIPFDQFTLALQGPVNVLCSRIGAFDITPVNDTLGSFRCFPPTLGSGPRGSIAKFVYEGTANLSSLGPAPTTGYTWHTTVGFGEPNLPCCRNANNNSNCSNGQMTLRVTMYSFVTTTGTRLSPRQMRDSAPRFLEDPAAIAINNPFDTSKFNNFAQDPDREDEVRFAIDNPWTNPNTICSYTGVYSIANPMPGLIGPAVDSLTGEMVYRPITNGAFVMAFKASSFRCGQLISEVFRDFQLNVISNPIGSPPPFNPNAPPVSQLSQQKAPIFVPFRIDAANRPVFDIEVYAGDVLQFPIQAYDINPLFTPTMDPDVDDVTILVTGPQLGANGASTTTGCLFPPCATISSPSNPNPPGPIRFSPYGDIAGYGYTATQTNTIQFNWTPGCNNLPAATVNSCGIPFSAYSFGAIALDNNSPIRGKTSQVFTVTVKTLPELDAPKLRCLSVTDDNLGIRLTWSQFVDTSSIDPLDSINYAQLPDSVKRRFSVNRRFTSFDSYKIYRATSLAGPYTLVGSTTTDDIYDTVFTDLTVVPGTEYYYEVRTASGCFNYESPPSNILKTISLDLNNNVTAGLAELSWDSLAVASQFPPSATRTIFIEREIQTVNPGVWERIDTINGGLDWDQSVFVCSDSVNFRVGFEDSSGCVSYSWLAGSVFDDLFPPAQVTMVQASVDNVSRQPYLTWDISPSFDVNRYIIYRVDTSTVPPSQFVIDTVRGYTNTYWLDGLSGQDPYAASLVYGVAAMDSCGNLGLMSNVFNTVYLEADMNECISSMELAWNHYKGWGNGIRSYRIMRQDGPAAPFALLDTMAANAATYAYIDNRNLIQDVVYCYVIEAVRFDDSVAYSNSACVQAKIIVEPQLTYIRKVNVDTLTGILTVEFMSDTAASSSKFELQRATPGVDFRPVFTFDLSQMVQNGPFWTTTYTDLEARTGENPYLYRVLVYDICDQLFDTSEVASSIFLQGIPEIDFNNNLRWNDYTSWLGGVESYTIMRKIPQVDLQYLPINQTLLGSPTFDDDISAFTDNDGNYLYYIEALEGNSNPLGLKDTVTSNIVLVVQQPRIYFPNAFLPLGVNREFKGKGVFIEEDQGFNLQVYNRWGERVFESRDYTLGWDGRANGGEVVSPGVYIYTVNFTGKNNKTYSQKGSLTVLR